MREYKKRKDINIMSNNINDRKKKIFDYVSMIIINEKNIKCIIDDK